MSEAISDQGKSDLIIVLLLLLGRSWASVTFGVDFVSQASGNNVVVVPIQPLKPKTTYIVVLTSSLKDSNGDSVEPSTTYELVRQDIATLPLGNAAQLGLQSVINSFEAKVEGEGVIHDEIIYTMAMTTQSTVDVMFTLKSLMAQQIAMAGPAAIPLITMADTGLSVADVLAGQIPAESLPAFSGANYLKGTINLPYYSGVPTADNAFAPVNSAWKSRCIARTHFAHAQKQNHLFVPASYQRNTQQT